MANGLYQTEGIILNRRDVGEADRIFMVFTKDFGLLRLFGRGVRRVSSKLNKFLNLFAYARFGFVSGKETWHLIDAEDLRRFDEILNPALGRVSNFIERFCAGEGEEPKLWKSFMDFIQSGDELLFYASALAALGYLDEKEINKSSRQDLAELIERAIASSQM